MSAVLNNTPVVAMLIPAVSDWAKRNRLPVSKLMIPLSYAAILGGTCTLIGTSTNLVVYGFMIREVPDRSRPSACSTSPGSAFPSALLGLAYILHLRPLAAARPRPAAPPCWPTRASTPSRCWCSRTARWSARRSSRPGLRHLPGMFLAEIDRDGHDPGGRRRLRRSLRANDRLVFAGIVESVVDLQKIRGLEPATDQVFKLERAARRPGA